MKSRPLKKINLKLVFRLVMTLVVLLFLYLFYFFYLWVAQYREEIKKPPGAGMEPRVMTPVETYRFFPPPAEIDRYAVFTLNRKGPARERSVGPAVEARDYAILGVVKRERLYLVVRLGPDRRIRLFARGMEIRRGHTVKRLTPTQVTIETENREEKVYKIFQLETVEENRENDTFGDQDGWR